MRAVEAQPVIADISLTDYNLSIADVQRKINRKTKTIILPHMFGSPADITLFLKLPVPVIEDCAQVLGAKLFKKAAGSFGAASIFSFYATKLITCGEGGMVASDDRRIIEKVKDIRSCDKKNDLNKRFNYKLSDFQGAMGSVQLNRLKRFIQTRKHIAQQYDRAFSNLSGLIIPRRHFSREHIYYRYVVRTSKDVDACIAQYHKNNIEASKPVSIPLHALMGLSPEEFPHTETAWKQSLSLPIYLSLQSRDVKKIIHSTKKILGD